MTEHKVTKMANNKMIKLFYKALFIILKKKDHLVSHSVNSNQIRAMAIS